MTQTERNDLARALGMGPDVCPEVWECSFCLDAVSRCEAPGNDKHVWNTTLPDPEGDARAAWLWEPALMRALKFPSINKIQGSYYLRLPSGRYTETQPTPTAALLAAWRAKG